MPAILDRYFRNEYIADPAGGEATETGAQPLIDQILTLLRTRTGHNFANYRRSTIQRRIQRRIGLLNIASVDAYLAELRDDPAEAAVLVKDLLINVTGFFRDAGAWSTLCELVIAPLIAQRESGAAIRAWVPGCSTGEEAYTLAMLIAEQATLAGKSFDVKIFATDAREDNLTVAREGVYPAATITGLDSTRQRRFFDASAATFRVKKDLRATVIFAPQNLLRDPPFSHLDLVTCRNLLIYLEPEAQKGVIALLHFALEQGGVLMLGNTETVGQHGVFEPLSKKWRIFKRLAVTRLEIVNFPVLRGRQSAVGPESHKLATFPASGISTADLARRALLERFAPASVLIDAASRVVYFHGSTSAFLEQPTGEPSSDLFTMTRGRLEGTLRSAVRKARDDACDVTFDAMLPLAQGESLVTVTVSPVSGQGKGFILVSFRPATPDDARVSQALPESVPHEIILRDELSAVRQELQNTIEHLENANEELKASNEEATSMNEELQSTNEELETSKEELQSVNEELVTVNSELQTKVEQLTGMQDDMKNLLDNISVGSIFLDRRLLIRRFTRDAAAVYRLVPSDVGRPLADIRCDVLDVDLLTDAQAVLDSLAPVEREVRTAGGTWYLARIKPYRTLDNVIDGVVLTFNDVTDRVHALAMRQARDLAEAVVDTVYEPLVVLDEHLQVLTANRAFLKLFGGQADDTLGRGFYEVANGQWDFAAMHELLDSPTPVQVPGEDRLISQTFSGIGVQHLRVRTRRVAGKSGITGLVLVSFATEPNPTV